jgi:hypothetical protein
MKLDSALRVLNMYGVNLYYEIDRIKRASASRFAAMHAERLVTTAPWWIRYARPLKRSTQGPQSEKSEIAAYNSTSPVRPGTICASTPHYHYRSQQRAAEKDRLCQHPCNDVNLKPASVIFGIKLSQGNSCLLGTASESQQRSVP